MLVISSKLSVGDIVALKPLQGADIIGRLVEDYKTGYDEVVLSKPLEAHVVQQGGGVGLAFYPFSLSAKDDQVFRIPRSSLIVDPFLARDEVRKTYIEQTTSLKLP